MRSQYDGDRATKKANKKKRTSFGSSEDDITYDFIPGLVEIVFREQIDPDFFSADLRASKDTARIGLRSARELQLILQKYHLQRAEGMVSTDPAEQNRFYVLYFPDETDLVSLLSELKPLQQVERAIVVPTLFPPSKPTNDAQVGSTDRVETPENTPENQWYIFRCKVNKAWDLATKSNLGAPISGKGVVVADLDWGARTSHQDLKNRIEVTYNSINNDKDVTQGPEVHHGTAVLSQIGAEVNGVGMAGIAYEASLWAIQGGDTPGKANKPKYWVDAIKFVRDRNAGGRRKIILLEVETVKGGNIEMVLQINNAIKEAIKENIVVCLPAGSGDRDTGKDLDGKPIDPTGAILVGSTSYLDDSRTKTSNWGASVVVSAPGDEDHDVHCGIHFDNEYLNEFGRTSGAAAKVAGVIALMLQANSALKQEAVRDILKIGKLVKTEKGKPVGVFLDAEAAVQGALANPMKVTPRDRRSNRF